MNLGIKFKFALIGLMSLTSVLFFGGYNYYLNLKTVQLEERREVAQQLISRIFERNLALSQYMLNPTLGNGDKVLQHNNALEETLLSAFYSFTDDHSNELLGYIQDNYDHITLQLKKELSLEGGQRNVGANMLDSLPIQHIFLLSEDSVYRSDQVVVESSFQLNILRQRAFVAVTAFGFFGFSLAILALYFSLLAVRSITLLREGAESIAGGNLNTLIPIKNKDELGILADTINTMAARLQASYSSLEQKIRERTASLEENKDKLEAQNKELEDSKLAMLNIVEDIEAEKERFRAQVLETKRFQQAVDQATDGVLMTSPDQKVIYTNKALEQLTGYKLEQLKNNNVNKIIDPIKTSEKVLTGMRQNLAKGKMFSTTDTASAKDNLYVRHLDGRSIVVELSIFPIVEQGDIKFFVGLIQDISQRTEIDAAKSEFVSLASHQLRTPMAGIQWVSELVLRDEELSEQGREYLEDIHTSVIKLSALVDLLLNVARIESGKVGITPQEFNVVEFIGSFLKEYKPVCDRKKLKVKFKEKPKTLRVKSDVSALRNIIQSLISNAVEYTPSGGSIGVALTTDKDKFCIEVSDSGIGIPKNEADKIFTKFVRAKNAQNVKADGTGLGLHIAKEATLLLGGKIWFESKGENKGTSFYVQLPVESKEIIGDKKLT